MLKKLNNLKKISIRVNAEISIRQANKNQDKTQSCGLTNINYIYYN